MFADSFKSQFVRMGGYLVNFVNKFSVSLSMIGCNNNKVFHFQLPLSHLEQICN